MRGSRIDSGARHVRFALQKPVDNRGTDGSVTRTWTDQVVLHGAYKQLRGEELVYAQQLVAAATATVTIGYRADITTAMRLKNGDRYFYIEDIDEGDLYANELILTVSERTAS